MAKINFTTIIIIILAIAVAVLLYFAVKPGGTLKKQPKEIEIDKTESVTLFQNCEQLCVSEGFSKSRETSQAVGCNPGENYVVYGYTGESPLLVCCCYNEEEIPDEYEEEYNYCEEQCSSYGPVFYGFQIAELLGGLTCEDYAIETCNIAGLVYSGSISSADCCCYDCDEPEATCYDSDISLPTIEDRLQFAGYCNDGTIYDDECYSSTHLHEYYCEGTPIHCGYTSYSCEGMLGTGAYCEAGKCIIPEADPYSYDECRALGDDAGKDYVTISTTDFWECDAYAWNHCVEILGKSIKYLDFIEPNCCMYSCI